jgi:hypothetical protein
VENTTTMGCNARKTNIIGTVFMLHIAVEANENAFFGYTNKNIFFSEVLK